MKKIIFLFILLAPFFTIAAGQIDVYFFVSQDCSYCEKANYFLDGLKKNGAPITVHQLEISHNSDNLVLFQNFAKAYDSIAGNVPAFFIGDKVIAGFYPDSVSAQITKCAKEGCADPQAIVEKYLKEQIEEDSSNNLRSWFFGVVILVSIVGIFCLYSAKGKS